MPTTVSRREFLRRAGLGAVSLMTPFVRVPAAQLLWQTLSGRPPEDVFGLAVASGDPTPTGVILWTRVNEAVWSAEETLDFQVALDQEFTQIVAQGLVNGVDFGPERDYTVKVDVDGLLAADTRYYYRFIYQATTSQVGRCRTLPDPTSAPDSVKFAVLTCQSFANGYYGAYHHLAVDEEIDFVLHLGDFIYEGSAPSSPYPGRSFTLPSGSSVAINLDDYRALYRTYRSDPFFQEAMTNHTFINIWDDHEMANDCYWDYANDAPGAPDHPYAQDPAALTQLKLDSQQAWAEYVPARPQIDPTAQHPHDFLSIPRSFRFGDLLDLFMADGRTYRAPHPCGEELIGQRYVTIGCDQQNEPEQTLLGRQQRRWLMEGLTTSTALWKVWGNQVLQARLRIPRIFNPGNIYLNLDAWDGYNFERTFIASRLKQAGVQNFVLLTGDLHAYMACYLKINYNLTSNNDPDNVIGVEFMTPAVTSTNLAQALEEYGIPIDVDLWLVQLLNPHVSYFNDELWGYSTMTFNRDYCQYDAYQVDKEVNSADAPRSLLRALRVNKDTTQIIDVTPLTPGGPDSGSSRPHLE